MKTSKIIFIYLIALIGAVSCTKDDEPKPEHTLQGANVVIVEYNIFEPRVWHSDSVYIVPSTVKIDASLVIEAGTIIKFFPDAGLEVWENGIIKAIGEKNLPILFTSIKDDSGGDSNTDLIMSSPGLGDWNFISLGEQNGSEFTFCIFSYGGNGNNSGVLDLGENYSKVEFCTFAHNETYVSGDAFYGALSAQDASSETILKNNTFYNNRVPLSINGHLSIDNSNTFYNTEDSTLMNKYNGIFVHGQDIISANTKWEETEVAYVIQYDGFEIWENFSLTLGDDVVLKFFTGAMLDLQTGNELINGQGKGVYFTSFKDDNLKGDTNGDGDISSPTENEWLGIYNHTDFYTWENILYSSNSY